MCKRAQITDIEMTDSSTPPIRNSDLYDQEEHTDLADVIRHAMFKSLTNVIIIPIVNRTTSFHVLYAKEIAIKINSLFNVHYVKIGYTASVMVLQRLNLTSW